MKKLKSIILMIKYNSMLSKAKNDVTRKFMLRLLDIENKSITGWKPTK